MLFRLFFDFFSEKCLYEVPLDDLFGIIDLVKVVPQERDHALKATAHVIKEQEITFRQ